MTTPQQSFSSHSHILGSSHRNADSSRFTSFRGGRNHNDNRRERGNRGYPRRRFAGVGRSNQDSHRRGPGNDEHGDMKTGLYKDSFLEDPWKDLIKSKRQNMRSKLYEDQPDSAAIVSDQNQDILADDVEGEIVLPDDEDDVHDRQSGPVGLGDGIVEAASSVSKGILSM